MTLFSLDDGVDSPVVTLFSLDDGVDSPAVTLVFISLKVYTKVVD